MKHKSLIVALLAFLMWGCQQEDFSHDLGDSQEVPALSGETVSNQEIATILEHVFSDRNNSRSAQDYTLVPVGTQENCPDFYIANYRGGGFVLISATKTYTPVLAYSESGNFYGLGDMPPALACWMENISQEIRLSKEAPDDSVAAAKAEWAAMGVASQAPPQSRMSISNELYHRLRDEIDDSIYSWHLQGGEAYRYDEYVSRHPERDFSVWNDEIESSIFIEYMEDWRHLCVVVERYAVQTYINEGAEISEPWNQTYPFNQTFPVLSNGQRAYVGCTNIAGALVMNHYKHPSYIQWDKFNSSDNYYQLSRFLLQLSELTNSEYLPGGTKAAMDSLVYTFRNYGYNANLRTGFSLRYLTYPSVISSQYYEKGKKQTHAWVVSRCHAATIIPSLEVWTFKTRNGHLERQIWETSGPSTGRTQYYINWGWGGLYNGYYVNISAATPPNTEFYRYNQMITNIRPRI